MNKNAWALRLKEGISYSEHEGKTLYLCDDDSVDYLTENLQEAVIIFDKEKEIQRLKNYDKFFIENFGEDSVRNFGWENISKNFEFVEVKVEESE